MINVGRRIEIMLFFSKGEKTFSQGKIKEGFYQMLFSDNGYDIRTIENRKVVARITEEEKVELLENVYSNEMIEEKR